MMNTIIERLEEALQRWSATSRRVQAQTKRRLTAHLA